MRRILLAYIVSIAALASTAFGQNIPSEPIAASVVNGIVTDQSRAVVGRAQITFRSNTSSVTTETAEDGSVHLTLPSGSYDVLISKLGFADKEIKNLQAQASPPASFHAVLEVDIKHGILEDFGGSGVEEPASLTDLPKRIIEPPALLLLAAQPNTDDELRYASTCPDAHDAMSRSVTYVRATESELLKWAATKVFPKKSANADTVHVQVQIEGEHVFCARATDGPIEKQKVAVDNAMQWKFKKKRGEFKDDLVGTLTFDF